MKRLFSVALVFGLVITLGCGVAFAAPASKEAPAAAASKKNEFWDLRGQYEKAMLVLHDAYEAKFMELDAVKSLASATKEDVRKLVDELMKIKEQMRQEKNTFMKMLEEKGLTDVHHRMKGRIPQGCPAMGDYYDGDNCGYGHGYRHIMRQAR